MVYIKCGEGYPSYNFEEPAPVPLKDVVSERHGLPLLRRSLTEINDDIDMAQRAQESHQRSLAQRSPKRYESRFVVDYLDALDDTSRRLGKFITSMAIRQLQLLIGQRVSERAGNS